MNTHKRNVSFTVITRVRVIMASVTNVQTILDCPPPTTQNIIQDKLTLKGNQVRFTVNLPSYILYFIYLVKSSSTHLHWSYKNIFM